MNNRTMARLALTAGGLALVLALPAGRATAAGAASQGAMAGYETPGWAAGETASPDAEADNDYRFVVVADSRGENRGVNEVALSAVFDAIGQLDPQPRFVFFVGDLVHGKRGAGVLRDELTRWRGIIDPRYDADKVYPVFGGHERLRGRSSPEAAWSGFRSFFNPVAQAGRIGGEPDMECRSFQRKFNPAADRTSYSRTVYYCDFEDDRFFVLNNDCIPEGHSVTGDRASGGCVHHELGCAQFNWVRHHLVGNGKRHNFFFHHEPAFGTGAHQANHYNDASCPSTLRYVMGNKKAPRNDYLRLLGFHNGTALFAGHEHQYTWRGITDEFVHKPLNNPDGVDRSLVLLIKADSVGQTAGPAVAYSLEGALASGRRGRAPSLRLWWTSAVGSPDWEDFIASGTDDAEQVRRGGRVVVDDTALELMRDEARGEQRFVALRWTNVPIPPGATIQRAQIYFTARESSPAGPRVKIMGEATPFAFPFTQCRKDLQRRRRGSVQVGWEIGAWRKNRRYWTPDLAPIIQELLDERGYATAFGGEIPEIKVGSSGAPWVAGSCERFMGQVKEQVIRPADFPGQDVPYHYAIVDVREDGYSVAVRHWDGTPLPVPAGY